MRWVESDPALVLLTLIVLSVIAIAVIFSVYAILLRLSHSRRGRLREALREQWEGPLLAAIADPAKVPEIHALVPRAYRMHFVQFVLNYARRVRGAERQTLRRVVEP
ncbi:MAG: hypothetical protein KJO65_06040, partial [Gemmatimonadetes bacterium]|nr:hypothetical protein [Gemmatimonadota bacterium]